MNRHALPDMDLRAVLAARDLECHLLVGAYNPDFPALLCAELRPLVERAYARPGELTRAHFRFETWGVTLRRVSDGELVACCTLGFRSSLASYFCVRYEAVEPSLQGKGVGRLLFECATLWTRFLLLNDVLVLEGVMRAGGTYYPDSCGPSTTSSRPTTRSPSSASSTSPSPTASRRRACSRRGPPRPEKNK